MAKEFNVGDRVFIPAKITKAIGGGHYKAEFFVGNDEAKTESFDAKVGTLFTAKQVSDKYIDGPTYDDLKTERDTLKMMLAERDRLLASANADITTLKSENERLSEQNEELGTKVDELEAELNNAKALNEFAVKTEQNREKLIAEQRELMKKYSVVIDVLIDKIVALRNGENNG